MSTASTSTTARPHFQGRVRSHTIPAAKAAVVCPRREGVGIALCHQGKESLHQKPGPGPLDQLLGVPHLYRADPAAWPAGHRPPLFGSGGNRADPPQGRSHRIPALPNWVKQVKKAVSSGLRRYSWSQSRAPPSRVASQESIMIPPCLRKRTRAGRSAPRPR